MPALARAYPEPPASPLWHRTGPRPRPRPLTPAQQRRNRELLLRAQHTSRPHPRTNTRDQETR
ncbi:hypothetical protein OG379_41310 (plasmid) [Streptomyces sp. NBC_01166]|uniref:hypothetical protein n=1 Tax=Streptomyces sp. NBC_01166 TaxID=2903755 RepID=UPI002F908CD0|nr:hypothetical protein OG379_41310 [Streptomyces sp. NBC_01166]